MKTSFKMGNVKVNVKVIEEADVNIEIDGIETAFEGTAEEVIESYKSVAGLMKDMVVAQLNARGCDCCDC
jgi:uncharacterized protein YqgV (UPF0045/DUF77 family)